MDEFDLSADYIKLKSIAPLWRRRCLRTTSLCCRRATGSDADRDRRTHTVLELSFGVPDHFVHILGVNENAKIAPTVGVHIRRGTFHLRLARVRFHVSHST